MATFPLSSDIPTITSKFIKGKWSSEEDFLLKTYVETFGEKKWKKISDLIKSRSPLQCLHRWTKILRPGMIKGPWTYEEDQKLIQWVKNCGANKWSLASRLIPGRNGKQCRERWVNHLNPDIKKGNWTEEEDEKIYQMYQVYGSAWSKIAKHFNGRSENSIKNRFYAALKKFDHVKKHSEILKTTQSENLALSLSTNDSPNKIDFKEEIGDSFFFNEQFFEDKNNFEDDSSDFEEISCKNEYAPSNCSPSNMGQSEVIGILNEIIEDDKRLDDKIFNMIESLKNIELQIMSKIANSIKQEEVSNGNITNKRLFEETGFDNFPEGSFQTKKMKFL